jgi:hypothetical protein
MPANSAPTYAGFGTDTGAAGAGDAKPPTDAQDKVSAAATSHVRDIGTMKFPDRELDLRAPIGHDVRPFGQAIRK